MTSPARDKPVAVVTGAGSGFGAAIANALAQDGWQVIAGVRHPKAHALTEHAGLLFQLDVCSPEDRTALVRHIQTVHGGRLDLLVNNAGGGLFGAHEETSEARLRAQFEVNLFAPALLIGALSPALRAARGRVITVSSALAHWPMPFTSGYCASKSAIDAFSQALHFELAPYGVQVALVEPGAHKTAFLRKASWVEPAVSQGSVYGPALDSYRKFRDDQNGRRDLPGPDRVARAVAKLATQRRMPLRIRVGTDARLLGLLRRVLPSPTLAALKHRIFKPWFAGQTPD